MRLLACLIVAPQRGYDEPAILSYAISSFCPTSADGRDGPMTPKAFHALFGRIGARAKMQFPIHPHMLRHGCGYRKRVGCSTGRSAGLVPLKMRSTRAAERSKISRRSGPYDIKPPSRVSESVS